VRKECHPHRQSQRGEALPLRFPSRAREQPRAQTAVQNGGWDGWPPVGWCGCCRFPFPVISGPLATRQGAGREVRPSSWIQEPMIATPAILGEYKRPLALVGPVVITGGCRAVNWTQANPTAKATGSCEQGTRLIAGPLFDPPARAQQTQQPPPAAAIDPRSQTVPDTLKTLLPPPNHRLPLVCRPPAVCLLRVA